jgi:tRNA G46 methylase TrmB
MVSDTFKDTSDAPRLGVVAESEHGKEYAKEVVIETQGHDVFVEVGVGTGSLCQSVALASTGISVFGVDLFRRDQYHLDQALSHQLFNMFFLQAPGEFPAKSFSDRHIDVLHLDVVDEYEDNWEQRVRFLLNAWVEKTKAIITPREYLPVLQQVLESWDIRENEHTLVATRRGLWKN